MSDRTAVYRLYDAADALLYVGVSRNPPARLTHHRLHQPWWAEVKRHELEWHLDRAAAIAAEATCIRELRPPYNCTVPQADGGFVGASRRLVKDGTKLRHLRIPDDLWERFGEAVKQSNPDYNRTQVSRMFMRWFVGDMDYLPTRPQDR